MSTKKKTKNTKATQRVEGEWVAEVRARVHKERATIERKVLTRGIMRFRLDPFMSDIVRAMKAGYEVRLTFENNDMIRLYPCLDTTLTKMRACAQAMKPFSDSLSAIDFHLARTDGKSGDDLLHEQNEARADLKNRLNVTPDTVVTCPKCGTEFRVGKQLQ